MGGKVKHLIHKAADTIETHSEFVRYMWPNKNISVRFKVLNFISCDWLRVDLNDIRCRIRQARMVVDAMNGEDCTLEQYKTAIDSIGKWLDRADRATEAVFKI